MLAEGTQKVFVRLYVLIILNLMFWLFSLIGLLVLGVGPAFRVITELYLNHKFSYHQYSLKEAWNLYKKYFWTANKHFYFFAVIITFLFYDLYLISQIKNIFILPISILLIFMIFLFFVVGMYSLIIESTFEVNFKNTVKLSFYAFFAHFKDLMLFFLGLIVLGMITKFFPGLLLFGTISGLIVWGIHSSKEWIESVSTSLEK